MNKIHSNGKRFFAPAIAAGLMLAMAFTLSACGGDGGGGGDEAPSSSSSGNGSLSSSSSGGGSLSSSSSGSGSSSSGTSSSSSGGDAPSSSSQPPPKCGEYNHAKQFCDERGEKLYKYVEINGQTWMAENLSFNADGSKCYDEDEDNCADYGRLYDWATAMGLDASCNSTSCSGQVNAKHRGICPSGWHIPSDAEWSTLINYVESDKGCSSCAGKHLKSVSGWNSYSGIVNLDSYGFSAPPGGYGDSGGNFSSVGIYGYWWSASENNGSSAYYRDMYYSNEDAYWGSGGKGYLFSVRCLQD